MNMAASYSQGVQDGWSKKEANPDCTEFKAAYLQGYEHGKNKRRMADSGRK